MLKDTTVTPVRLEPTALQFRVKHSTTEPLRSLLIYSKIEQIYAEPKIREYLYLSRNLVLHFRMNGGRFREQRYAYHLQYDRQVLCMDVTPDIDLDSISFICFR